MLKQCSTLLFVLLLVSLVSRMAMEASDSSHANIARSLIDKAIHWRNVASNESALNSYHHLIASLTFLHSAREIMSDSKLEMNCGLDISSLIRDVEQQIARARQIILLSQKREGGSCIEATVPKVPKGPNVPHVPNVPTHTKTR